MLKEWHKYLAFLKKHSVTTFRTVFVKNWASIYFNMWSHQQEPFNANQFWFFASNEVIIIVGHQRLAFADMTKTCHATYLPTYLVLRHARK